MNAVHRLHLASVKYEDGRIPVYAYLIVGPDSILLVDTGVGEGNLFIDDRFAPDRRPVATALNEHGVSLDEVQIVVNSHLHFDHCGNNRLFTESRVVVQEAELTAAREPRYTVRDWFETDQLQPVCDSTAIADGVRVLSTPGHTPGHQSVLVETTEGLVLIAAQAAWTAEEYLAGGDPGTQAHAGLDAQYLSSIELLKQVHAPRVLFSHDDREADDSAGHN